MKQKKPIETSTFAQWTTEWYHSATPEELLRALDAIEQETAGDPMEQLVKRLTWEARFQLLEEELERRMRRYSA